MIVLNWPFFLSHKVEKIIAIPMNPTKELRHHRATFGLGISVVVIVKAVAIAADAHAMKALNSMPAS